MEIKINGTCPELDEILAETDDPELSMSCFEFEILTSHPNVFIRVLGRQLLQAEPYVLISAPDWSIGVVCEGYTLQYPNEQEAYFPSVSGTEAMLIADRFSEEIENGIFDDDIEYIQKKAMN